MSFRYVPILKTKVGEIAALANLSPVQKSRVFPLMRATSAIPATFQRAAIAALPGMYMALDGEHNSAAGGTFAHFSALFHGLGNGNVLVIPAVSFGSDPSYLTVARGLIGTYAPGVVVQVDLADLPHITSWCASTFQITPSDIDLVINAGDVSPYDSRSMAGYVRAALTSTLSATHSFRSVTLNSYSAAKDHGGYAQGRNIVPRRCWQVWNAVVPTTLLFQLDFSDCGHVHPSLDEVPGYAMANATVSVRYTINDHWVVLKGTPTTGAKGQSMTTQYRAHAQALLIEPEFNSLSSCWGDTRIQAYAATTGKTGAGGRTQWVEILLNRHIAHVCDRLP